MIKSRWFVLLSFLVTGCGKETIIQQVEVQPADPVSTEITVDIIHSEVSGNMTLNGAAFPSSIYSYGKIVLEDTNSNSRFTIANTNSGTYASEVIHGTYNIYYDYETGVGVPANKAALIQSNVEINADTVLDIDLPAVSVEATFRLNGATFPELPTERASFYLQPVNSDELILLGQSHLAANTALVVPGDYHVIYSHEEGDSIPRNKNARVLENVTINANVALRVDVASADARFLFQHNGQAWSNSLFESGNIYLVNDAHQDEVLIANTRENTVTASVVSSTYNVHYRYFSGVTVPFNTDAVVLENVDLSEDSYTVNVLSSLLSVQLSLNGANFPTSVYDNARIEAYSSSNENLTLIGYSNQAIANVPLINGDYNLVYSLENGGVAVPINKGATVREDITLAAQLEVTVDILAFLAGVDFSINGNTSETSVYNKGLFILEGEMTSEPLIIGGTAVSALDNALVIAGNYDLKYALGEGGVDIPRNASSLLLSDQAISSATTFSVDVDTARVDLNVVFNGSGNISNVYNQGRLYAVSTENAADDFTIALTNPLTEDIIFIPGSYDIYYSLENGGVGIPLNSRTRVGSFTFEAN